jgi:multicomponent Na+:H+ antiporter subunit A
MVKAGVYLLMRLSPVFAQTELWQTVLPLFGAVTLLVGAVLALRQTDLKLMLAYTTVASLGLLVMLTGMGTQKAVEAAVLYLVAHALFKGALFMIAGVIDHETGTRDITRLAGLRAAMPLTFGAALLAALSMGGLPFFAGFMAKEEVYAALTGGEVTAPVLLLAAIAGNAIMVAIGFAIALKPFIGAPRETPKHAHDGPLLLMAGPVLLAFCGLAAGLLPAPLHRALTSPMASAIADEPLRISISGLPHLGVPFALSVATIVLGAAILRWLAKFRAVMGRVLAAIGWGPDRGFDQAVTGLVRMSSTITRFLQPGRLEIYLLATFIVIAASLLWPMFAHGELPALPAWPSIQLHEAGFMLFAVIGVLAVLTARSRLTAIVSLGIQGFAVAVLYLLFGAPDLSFTQFMVETLSVVILALIMTRLRLDIVDRRSAGQVLMDGAVAIACGLGFTLFLLRAVAVPFNGELTAFFSQYSKVLAHGANVVNVIIVDFRGTDTLGEIAVVVITGLAILALIRLRVARPSRAFNDPDEGEGKAT